MLSCLGRSGELIMKRKLDAFLRDSIHSMASTTGTRASPSPLIQLTPREQQLRHLLLDVAKSIDASNHPGEPVILRWAGGWVRDKLLGIESHDIDVAINIMTGQSFAQHLSEFCKAPQAIAAHGIGSGDVGNLHKVASNPEKSKHLETAMVRLFGLDVDFVNLRKETYAQDSRNPQMDFGTAEEDALRRDATINALFYNLNTQELEDFAGGEDDLSKRIIRTPLDPLQTFMDDPLRVLRLIRFAARLSFTIHATTEAHMNHPRVLDALKVKISRERVGVELEKMLKGAHPSDALQLIDRLGLYHAVFTDPSQENPRAPDASRWHVVYKCLDDLLQQRAQRSISDVLVQNDEAAYVAWNLAAVCPWIPVEAPPDKNQKANALPPVAVIAREGFRAPNKLTAVMTACFRHHSEILDLKAAVVAKAPRCQERDRFGMSIRKWEAQGGMWRLQVLATMLVEAMKRFEMWPSPRNQEQDTFVREWQAFLDHLAELDVYDAPSLSRLLDGRSLAKALGLQPGMWTGKALDICMAWQLRHPGETDPAGAIEEVKKKSEQLGITLPATK